MTGAEPPFRTPILSVSRLISAPWERWLRNLGQMATSSAGIHRYGTHQQRLDLKIGEVADGTTFSETDRGDVEYQIRAGVWKYLRGIMRGKLADKPAGLGANDANFHYQAVDYWHILRWTGTEWERAPEDLAPSGVIECRQRGPWSHVGTVDTNGTAVTWKTGPKFDTLWGTVNRIRINNVWYPVASVDSDTGITLGGAGAGVQVGVQYAMCLGWHFCDGNGDDGTPGGNISVMARDGTTENLTVEDLTVGVYLKAGATVSGINAAVAPGFSGAAVDPASAGTPAGAVTVNPAVGATLIGTGAANAATAGHAHGASFAGSPMADHLHTLTGGAVDDTGEPTNKTLFPYLRK